MDLGIQPCTRFPKFGLTPSFMGISGNGLDFRIPRGILSRKSTILLASRDLILLTHGSWDQTMQAISKIWSNSLIYGNFWKRFGFSDSPWDSELEKYYLISHSRPDLVGAWILGSNHARDFQNLV